MEIIHEMEMLIRNCWCACGHMSISISWIISIKVKMMILFHCADYNFILAHSAAVHFCPAAAAISIVKKHHHLDFNGNNSWNGNAHVTTGTSTIPYEASVPASKPASKVSRGCTMKNFTTIWVSSFTTLHCVANVYIVLPFYNVKCLCSGGREWGREESHSH